MEIISPRDILVAEKLDPQQAVSLLRSYGFQEPVRADAILQSMADDPVARRSLAEIIEELLACAHRSADPDQAIGYFERFARASVSANQLFSYLAASPRTLEMLTIALGASPYMAEILIRNPLYLYWLGRGERLYQRRLRRDLERDLAVWLAPLKAFEKQLDALRIFKRREMLRIGVRDLLRLASISETLSSLSLLAEVLISAACRLCRRELNDDGGNQGFTVIGMGKLGGGELNFSSDVDLIYLYDSETRGEFSRRLAQKMTAALSDVTAEGYVYRVDLRLRPEGRVGKIAYSLDACTRYYETRGADWERLALLKAWPVAGDRKLGMAFLERTRPFVLDRPFDVRAVNAVKQIKRKIDEKMLIRRQKHRNVKLGFGGIREIELIAQTLQLSFGRRLGLTSQRNTLRALKSLRGLGAISAHELKTLSQSYLFLRDVENKLQMVNDAQTHSLPDQELELAACARRLGYTDTNESSAVRQFLLDYQQHTASVNRIFQEVVGSPEGPRLRMAEAERG
jgi:glutamate-ammonia-ligase adenylyltransferase